MAGIESGLFTGWLRHRRFVDGGHQFRYPVFMALLDIDRLPSLMDVSPFTSYNGWNWAAFHERDHFGDPHLPLRERLRQDAAAAGLVLPAGRVLLLTHLRYLGYCFNPVSFFYCLDSDDRIALVLAEVNNTFGGTHNYWLEPDGPSALFRSAAEKALYVSPFMGPALTYGFALTPPADRAVVHMKTMKDETLVFDATLSLERRPWSAREIRRALVRHPAMTASVVAGIHWQALRLWWKGVPVWTS